MPEVKITSLNFNSVWMFKFCGNYLRKREKAKLHSTFATAALHIAVNIVVIGAVYAAVYSI